LNPEKKLAEMTPDLKKIEERIYQNLPALAPHQKKVAHFFLEHMDLVALLPIQEVARRAGTSEATIVRFTQLLGYRGYKEIKETLSANLKAQLSPTARYHLAVAEKEKSPDILKLCSQNVISNIQETIKSVDPQAFSGAVESIIHARHIYCIGLELSSNLAQLMTYLLRQYSYEAQHLSLDYFCYHEQVAFMRPEDLIIAFSFSPYSRETVEALSLASKRSIPSILFTDKKSSPARASATHCLPIKTDNITFSNSLGAVVTVINAIIAELNFRDKERTLTALGIIEEVIQNDRYIASPS
jgi:DNA-binding MurR/RpiR family transcriptional regulator